MTYLPQHQWNWLLKTCRFKGTGAAGYGAVMFTTPYGQYPPGCPMHSCQNGEKLLCDNQLGINAQRPLLM